jgi:hypothetical protein
MRAIEPAGIADQQHQAQDSLDGGGDRPRSQHELVGQRDLQADRGDDHTQC